MNLRTRIAVLCAAVTASVALVAGFVVLRVVESELVSEVDQALVERSETFQPVVLSVLQRDGRLAEGLEPLVGASPARGGTGEREVFRLGPVPAVAPPDGPGFDTVTVDGASWRRFTTAESTNGDRLLVELFAPLESTQARIDAIRRRALLVALAAVVGAALLGYLLGRTVTSPLGRLVRQAGSIGTSDARVNRIEAGGTTAEVRELEATLNDMLDRIDVGLDRTRAALESSRAFTADAAHELRTPLTAMAGNLEILRRHPDLDPEVRDEIVAELSERQAWMERLLASLRELARSDLAGGGPPEVVDLAELVDASLAAVGPRPDDVSIEFSVEGSHRVLGHPDGLRIVVDNLVRNAIGHGRSEDGVARISVTLAEARSGAVRLVVDDRGPGVPPEDRAKVRERFQRGRTRAAGTGLGLALVQREVERHGGTLTIGDAPGGGARFTVELAGPADDSQRNHTITTELPYEADPPWRSHAVET